LRVLYPPHSRHRTTRSPGITIPPISRAAPADAFMAFLGAIAIIARSSRQRKFAHRRGAFFNALGWFESHPDFEPHMARFLPPRAACFWTSYSRRSGRQHDCPSCMAFSASPRRWPCVGGCISRAPRSTIFASAEQMKPAQNEHDRSGSALQRVRQIRCLYARALPSSCDMPRISWTVDREDLVFIQQRDRYWCAQRNSLKESPRKSRNKRVGGGGSAKLARMQATMVDLSTKQSINPNAGPVLSE
jgi:hypothetical protein